jgi:hypothetical protein
MRRWQRWAAGIAFGLVVAAVAIAPFPLLLLPNPAPVPVKGPLVQQQPGVFVRSGTVTYHVFPRAEDAEKFPSDAPAVGTDAVVWVRAKQLDDPQAYEVVTWPDGAAVPVSVSTRDNKLLGMTPTSRLAPGRYCAHVARGGLEDGVDFVYFTVAAKVTASADASSPASDRRGAQ